MEIHKKFTLLCIAGSVVLGVGLTLGASQVIWLASANIRIETYSASLLNHAEMVAENLTTALDELNKLTSESCSPLDLDSMKLISYNYRFIKDSGRVIGNNVICSAMWGKISPAFHIEGEGQLTKNNARLWRSASSYFPSATKIDISAKGHSFVVTSPTAFAPYEHPSEGLSSSVTSRDGSITRRSFGEFTKSSIFTGASSDICSDKYDICIKANIVANFFSMKRFGLISFISVLGALLGLMVFYTVHQFRKVTGSLTYKLKVAINNGLISTAYQPIVHGATGGVVGFEVLARWHDKKFGAVSPDVFIRKAEKLGLEKKLHELIVSKAFEEYSKGLSSNPGIYLAFNVSTKDLVDGALLNHISNTASLHNVALEQIAIEILEGSTCEISQMGRKIEDLRIAGYKVLLDDFGSGYSSLAYLAKLNVDVIKIDKTFTQAAGTDSPAAVVLKKVYEIAHALNAKVVFEGVETEHQKKAILEICPDALMQGWLFSKALPIAELTATIKSQADSGNTMIFAHD